MGTKIHKGAVCGMAAAIALGMAVVPSAAAGTAGGSGASATLVSTDATYDRGLDLEAGIITSVEQDQRSLYAHKAIAVSDDQTDIYASADTQAEVVGHLAKNAGCDVLGSEGAWTHIASGGCEGYVRTDSLAIGLDAEEYARETGFSGMVAQNTSDGDISIYAEPSTDSAVIATVGSQQEAGALCTVSGASWVEVSIDSETGFVQADEVELSARYAEADAVTQDQPAEADTAETAAQTDEQTASQTDESSTAQADTAQTEESTASASADTASAQTMNETVYAVTSVRVRAAASTDSSILGVLSTGDSVTRTADENGWSTVSYNGQTGYVKDDYLSASAPAQQSSDTSSSSPSSADTSSLGQQIADFAVQYVGYPYVYGGNSLTNGVDCSGFVQQVYLHFGISTPRTATAQAEAATKISESELQAGDLIFYGSNGSIGHVAIYLGDGRVVHASNYQNGIMISNYNYRSIVCCGRFR
ncbi:MAG: NlpC/P60 family protein [Lachnospiraceae bacterium]|jgi:cell wall-associated NlpC family hydrolase